MEQNLFEPIYREIFPFWNEISESDRELICRNSFAVNYHNGANIHRRGMLRRNIRPFGQPASLYDVRGR